MQQVKVYAVRIGGKVPLPLYLNPVACGFPSPADDYIHKTLDLNEHLIRKTTATFFVRAIGDSMIGAGIQHNDLLIVDQSVEPYSGAIVLAIVGGAFTVKRLRKRAGSIVLEAENPRYPPIEFCEGSPDLEVCGVITYSITRQSL